jgi:diguanylate cyclase (GGDEF)-like protein
MEKLDLLSSVELFSQLSLTDLNLLADHATFYDFADGEHIFREGTVERELFVIGSGEVRIVKDADEHQTIDIARFVAGESFGEQDFLSEQPRTASAVSEGASRILIFPERGTAIDTLMLEYPQLFARVLHQFLVIVAGRIRSTNKLVSENSGWVEDLRRQVFADKLTGLYSKTYLDDEVPRMLARGGGSAGLLMIKPDNFKDINDTFGHEVGDRVLRLLASHLRGCLHDDDIPVRFRGNEFAVVVPGATADQLLERADAIRDHMKHADLSSVTGETRVPLTFSIAAGIYPDDAGALVELVHRVHEEVFVARDAGGDRVHMIAAGDR